MRIYASMKTPAESMTAAADEASELLKSLANRHRLLILCQLVDGERPVGELAARLGVRDSTVSQHLALLRKDGLVRTRREGQTIHYALVDGPARRVLETLFTLYCPPATAASPTLARRRRAS
jgi:DNA-binding transcriptional ArsR family regulator